MKCLIFSLPVNISDIKTEERKDYRKHRKSHYMKFEDNSVTYNANITKIFNIMSNT